jgi:3-deoxy-D-manno-octulosonate 8-phosphate phosphatase (KDO 8-P phosphatase)
MNAKVIKIAKNIKGLILDVDGVLTNRKLYIPERDDLIRRFDVHDGFGVRMWVKSGRRSAVLTGGTSQVIHKRAKMLGIEFVYTSKENKLPGYENFLKETGLKDEEVCFVADDLFDLPVFERVGLPIAVRDAHHILLERAAWIPRYTGGNGAVREVVDQLLFIQGEHPYQKYFKASKLGHIESTQPNPVGP